MHTHYTIYTTQNILCTPHALDKAVKICENGVPTFKYNQ